MKRIARDQKRLSFTLVLCLAACFFAGCAYFSILPEDNIKRSSFAGGQERIITYNCAVIKGKVIGLDEIKKPALIVAYPLSADGAELTNYIVVGSNSTFMLYLSEGRYRLYAFTDYNNDGIYTENEVSGVYGSPASPVEISLSKEDLVKDVVIHASKDNVGKIVFPRSIRIDERQAISQLTYNGQLSKIYDEKFSPANAAVGWWNPTTFMKFFGAHIYLVEEYDPGKIPILFVHGAEGSPQNWVYFLMRLDRSRYQPWFFYYPSGIHLSLASLLLYDALMELHGQYRFRKMCVVAHSMGGLVARSLLTRYRFDKSGNFVKTFVTFATPWSGFESADTAQIRAGRSLPSWMDIGAQSVFVQRTLNAKLPRDINYYLFYGREDHVSAGRALDDRAVSGARETMAFNCDHNSILTDRDVFRKFNAILQKEFY